MKSRRDYELVKSGKYNMRAIMQLAWAYTKMYKESLKEGLSLAWIDAKVAKAKLSCKSPMNKNLRLVDFCMSTNSAFYAEVSK